MRYLYVLILLFVVAFGQFGCLEGREKALPGYGELVLSGPDAGMSHWLVDWKKEAGEKEWEGLAAALEGEAAAMITLQAEEMPVDEVLRAWLKKIARACPRIYIRYNPEMELPIHEHTWQMKAPKE